jgi:hypothetical protein
MLNLQPVMPAATAAIAATSTTRPKAEFYINIGCYVTITRDGAPEEVFVSLPFGLALDTMQEADVGNHPTSEYGLIKAAQNALLAKAKEQVGALAPGATMPLPFFSVEARRVGAKEAPVAAGQNPFAAFSF